MPLRVGVPPPVDELVVVADHEEAAEGPRQDVDEGELRAVEILELVHEDVTEPLLHEAASRGLRQHVGHGEPDLVVEGLAGDGALRPQVDLVRGRERQRGRRGPLGRLYLYLHVVRVVQSGTHHGERREEGADGVAAARGPDPVGEDAGLVHGSPHGAPLRGAVEVDPDGRPEHLPLVAVAESVERGAVDAGLLRRPAGATPTLVFRRRPAAAWWGCPRPRAAPRAARRPCG